MSMPSIGSTPPPDPRPRTAGDDPPAGSDDVDLTDYERARDEIDNRTQLSSQLLNYNLVIVAAVLSAYNEIPREATIAAACVSSVFWLMWIDHTGQIYKLAAYLELDLARRVRERHPGSLGWERFLRELDAGGDAARRALGPRGPANGPRIPQTTGISRYVSLLFGGSSLALLLAFGVEFGGSVTGFAAAVSRLAVPTGPQSLHAISCAAGVGFFGYALLANSRLRQLTRTVGAAIRAAAQAEERRP